MISFKNLLENINEQETKSMLAIRNGIGIKKDFWEDFLLLLNNSEAVAELFGLPLEKVATWRNKIYHILKEVKKIDEKIIPREKSKLLKTGLPENK